MEYRPHEYQRYAIRYVEEHPVSALLLDCGLGKTSVTLTALADLMFDSFEVSRTLVVAPLRVAAVSWPEEIRKWDHLKGLRYAVAVGTEEERREALRKRADITIVNRENVAWLVEDSGFPFDWDCLVVDELSSFKNHRAKRFRVLMRVRPMAKRVIGLTGTPSANGLMDLWAEYRLLDMGERLGRYLTRFRERWFRPDRRSALRVFSYKPLPGAEEEIYKAIGDITVSMRSTDHLAMPSLVVCERTVVLSGEEREAYRRLKEDMVAGWRGKELTAGSAAVLSGKLLQLANGSVYADDGSVAEVHSRKLDALEDLVEEAAGKPMLVAYWYRHDLERIEKRLRDLGVVFADLRSAESIRRWQAGELAVGLIHPASAGHGLNLQDGGGTIVWYGPIWSLELYRQTNARLWRQGQKERTVVVIRIVAEGTIDSRVLEALEGKDRVQERLLDAVKTEVEG